MPLERPNAALCRQVSERARKCCEYCFTQQRFSSSPFSVEHILPRSRGGLTESGNLALACQGCNNRKYNHVNGVDPISGEVIPLYHPRKDIWKEHFAWTEDYAQIVGLTARGRATVLRMQLNRPEIVALRQILIAARVHPPHYPSGQINP